MTREIEALFRREAYPLEVHAGRDIGAGHLRGWGLEYGDLYEGRVVGDPLFAEAFRAARARGSLLALHKLANLYLVIRYAMAEDAGDIYEFGSFMGGSAVFMGVILRGLRRLRDPRFAGRHPGQRGRAYRLAGNPVGPDRPSGPAPLSASASLAARSMAGPRRGRAVSCRPRFHAKVSRLFWQPCQRGFIGARQPRPANQNEKTQRESPC